MLTQEDIQAALPTQVKTTVSPELIAMVNNVSQDPEAAKLIRENFVSYTGVLKEGRFKTEDYISAVAYVSFKMMGYNNTEAYQRTFPARYTTLVARGASKKDISAYVAAYNKNKLVNLILEQTLVPMWVLNQDAYQAAINTQVELMTTARSEKVRSDAANSLLTHLKRPEKHQVELNLGVKETSGMVELRNALVALAEQQRELISSGVSTRDVAHQKLVEGRAVEISEDVEDAEIATESAP